MTATGATRRLITILALALAWCGLWRTLSVANIVTGLALGTALTLSGIGSSTRNAISFVPLAKLAGLILLDLITSTVNVAVEIVTPTDRTDEGIIAVQLPDDARRHLLLLTIAITLTPGTAVVDVHPDDATLYLHLLHIEHQDSTIAHVHELAKLATAAFPARSEAAT